MNIIRVEHIVSCFVLLPFGQEVGGACQPQLVQRPVDQGMARSLYLFSQRSLDGRVKTVTKGMIGLCEGSRVRTLEQCGVDAFPVPLNKGLCWDGFSM